MTIQTDPRAGTLCTNCNAARADARAHCENPKCSWWKCKRCAAMNDKWGHNDRINAAGHSKTGAA
jgi:hypothetical protein